LIAFASSISFKLPTAGEAHWAVLVAGSNGFWNYRHQSDICHSYKILVDNGVHPDRIITLAYDDIANSSQNPFKGKVFNKPDPKGLGVDVYAGCNIDYKGNQVTPETFLDVITGKDITYGSKKTLKSTSADNVFIYFSDHGATGLIAFPNGELYANDLINALTNMHAKKMYSKLVFYLEACESGSMFTKLPKNIGIYATTAANASESSWATYCSPDDKVNGKSIGSCLGDEYSVTFLEDTEASIGLKKTLSEQFVSVKQNTKKSHVQQFGDLTFAGDSLSQFEADTKQVSTLETMDAEYIEYLQRAKNSRVDSRDVKLHYLYQKAIFGTGHQAELESEINHRRRVDAIFNKFNVGNKEDINIDFKCLKDSVESFKSICKEWSDYSLKYVRTIAIACETVSAENIKNAFLSVCQ
jgi:legumain